MTMTMKTTLLALCCALALAACEEAASSPRPATPAADAAADDPDSGASPPAARGDAGEAEGDAGSAGSGHDGGPDERDCFSDPKTYLEIINACTDAEKIDKKPALPLLLADGGLPDLP